MIVQALTQALFKRVPVNIRHEARRPRHLSPMSLRPRHLDHATSHPRGLPPVSQALHHAALYEQVLDTS